MIPFIRYIFEWLKRKKTNTIFRGGKKDMKTITLTFRNTILLIGLYLCSTLGFSQSSQTFSSSGTWTCPADNHQMQHPSFRFEHVQP